MNWQHLINSNPTKKWYTTRKIVHNNNLYMVIFVGPEKPNTSIEDIEYIKKGLECDIALRSNNKLYFCQQIENANIIE